jgi:hypothetical protein
LSQWPSAKAKVVKRALLRSCFVWFRPLRYEIQVFPPLFRLAFHIKNIHTAAVILLLLIGMLAAEDSVTKVDQVLADTR